MTRDDALTIVGMIVNSWPGPVWEADRLDAYATALIPYDAEVTTKAVARAVGAVRYRPSIAELRDFIRIELASSRSEREEGLRQLPRDKRPTWVNVWAWSRFRRDPPETRGFPQQQGWGFENVMPVEDYYLLEGEWMEAGSPEMGTLAPPLPTL